jgi:1,4-alpha-glucan branching enzyme
MNQDAINALVRGDHGDPFSLLGEHITDQGSFVRILRPNAKEITLLHNGKRTPLKRVREEGLFEGHAPALSERYQVEEINHHGDKVTFYDPYTFNSQLGEMDLYLLHEGRHLHSYDKLGAHIRTIDGVTGVHFAVWAPNAYRVSVIGNFNGWDSRVHPMLLHHDAGIWELFIPGVQEGALYRYHVRSRQRNFQAEKSDPFAFYGELRPGNASIVHNIDGYEWGDAAWMEQRANTSALRKPMSVYEVHLGSWKRTADHQWLTYRELADQLVQYVKDMGYTHIELMPIAEHPFDGSWGYQVTGYFAPTSRYGKPQDFMYFVDQCHQNGIGVILDWVPAHFPKDGHGLAYFDGTALYEHADPRKGEHPDWGTFIFNFGRNEVKNFLISNALFWLKYYHIDGLRVDAVSSMLYLDFSRKAGEWLPNKYGGNENLEAIEFIKESNSIIHQEAPGAITIAEESTAWANVSRPVYIGGLGYTFKWNMGWMHDTLEYLKIDPLYRRYHHNKMTFAMMYAYAENFVLSLSHDEVVHGKGSLINKAPGDWWQKFATIKTLFGYHYSQPGKKLNFMGAEIGQWNEWSEARSLDWHLLEFPTHSKLQQWVRDLNHFYRSEPALWELDNDPRGFEWIEPNDADNSTFSFIRYAEDREDFVVFACNFTPVPRLGYRIGVPQAGTYLERLNSDSLHYGGGNVGNKGAVNTDAQPFHKYPQSLSVNVPPLGVVLLKWQRPPQAQETADAGATDGA